MLLPGRAPEAAAGRLGHKPGRGQVKPFAPFVVAVCSGSPGPSSEAECKIGVLPLLFC
jgi:hypothetical protein